MSERLTTIALFAKLCAEVSALSEGHDSAIARAYAALGGEAERLVREGFDESDVRALALADRPSLDWLNPKMAEFDRPRAPWEDTAASALADLDVVALDLRTIGSLD